MIESHNYARPGATNEETQKTTFEMVKYDNLTSMLLDLRAGNINSFYVNSETAAYIVAQNEDLETSSIPLQRVDYSMATLKSNTEVYDILNKAIVDIKADGTMDQIINNYLKAYETKDPEPIEMPIIEGAPTYKVAVTGDMPTLDYVSSDGKPAGFNVALLSEISKRANVNIEPVVVESGAKSSALSSSRVDAFFWISSTYCSEHPEFKHTENLEQIMSTEPYIALDIVLIRKK
ncbi:MAG: transporter substrate-binding domain-containing protein [Clostridia bacterium]|nr:transporter substrate-binding domain-containing protein [Clostridia bacterium]